MAHSSAAGLLCGVLAAVLLAVFPAVVLAQRVVAVTETLTATREAAGVYVQCLDLSAGAALPGPEHLPGRNFLGPSLLHPDAESFLVATGEPESLADSAGWRPAAHFTTFRASPFERLRPTVAGSDGWLQWAGGLLDKPGLNIPQVLVLGSRKSVRGAWQGRLDVAPWEKAGGWSVSPGPLALPGAPMAAVHLGGSRIAVLCRDALGSGATVALCLWDSRRVRRAAVGLGKPGPGVHAKPAGFALSQDGAYLLVLLSGFTVQEAPGEPLSWLRVLDSHDLRPVSDPLTFPGHARIQRRSLVPATDRCCWIVTAVPGTDFAYATRLHLGTDGTPAKEAEYPLAGAAQGPLLALAPASADVCVALDNRLEVWPEGERGLLGASYGAPITALKWTDEGLLAGEGGRVHAVNTLTGAPLRTVQLHTGHVRDLIALPQRVLPAADEDGDGLGSGLERAQGTAPDCPDTDGDGIHDGIDPEPLIPSPRLEATPELLFDGEAAGRQVRALRIWHGDLPDAPWRLSYDDETMPWLLAHPRSGVGRGVVLMGLDPARYEPGSSSGGVLRVEMDGTRPGFAAAGSPAEVLVRVAPPERTLHRILWVWAEDADEELRGPSDARRLGGLAKILAGAPLYFSHEETVGPFPHPLFPYSIVVLDARAAVQGAVTRQAVLDYVSDGGALLFLGAYLEDEGGRSLRSWLKPLGIEIDVSQPCEGTLEAVGEERAVAFWQGFSAPGGCVIEAEERHHPGSAAAKRIPAGLVAREYGFGRIALVAGTAPFEGDAVRRDPQREFTKALFRWLVEAGAGVKDLDADGLPDSTEDPRNLSTVDAGETDFLNPDTDSDGIPDGLEDANRSGWVDDGETDPRNRDSDGDGVMDGADLEPCPALGTPIITGVERYRGRAEGPAEGGVVVIVSGRNFAPDSVFWFGERRAPWAQVAGGVLAVVRTPPHTTDEGGKVPVRVVSAGGALEGVLPDGFEYTPRSEVRLTIREVSPKRQRPEGLEGAVALGYADPEEAWTGRAVFVLRAFPGEGHVWGQVEPAAAMGEAGRSVQTQPSGEDSLIVVVESGDALRADSGDIVRVAWTRSADETSAGAIGFDITGAWVTNKFGGLLRTTTEGLGPSLETPDAAPVRRKLD